MKPTRRISSTLPLPTPGQRLAVTIARATGVVIDPVLACPHVNDNVLEFAATPAQAADIARTLRELHGIEVRTEAHDSDPADVFAVVYINLPALVAKIGA